MVNVHSSGLPPDPIMPQASNRPRNIVEEKVPPPPNKRIFTMADKDKAQPPENKTAASSDKPKPTTVLPTEPLPPGVSAAPVAVNTPADQAHPDLDMPKIATGELEPGQMGYLPLDEKGQPVGDPVQLPPSDGTPYATVRAMHEETYHEVTTPTGAPITPMMNPVPTGLMDEGFLARNPPVEAQPAPTTPVKPAPNTAAAKL